MDSVKSHIDGPKKIKAPDFEGKIGRRGNESLEHHQKLTLNHESSSNLSPLSNFVNALKRKKPLDCRTNTSLNRCLGLLDLTTLGVGSTLGLGLYVLAGQVASSKAGPGVIISFALAAIASAFSALCYAEFAGLVPRAGSAYAYSYITMGEFVAFIIGWNLLLEYVIGAASVARGFSGYIRFVWDQVCKMIVNFFFGTPFNTMTSITSTGSKEINKIPAIISTITSSIPGIPSVINSGKGIASTALVAAANISGTMQTLTTNTIHTGDSIFSYSTSTLFSNLDSYISLAIVAAVTLFILMGVKGSTNVTFAFTGLNLFVVGTLVICSISQVNLHNWQLSKSEVPHGFGEGGFIPYGWSGVLAGSATCFFGFIGFDTIASSAEEAQNPRRNVPLSILLSLFISFLAYMAIAIVQTLIWPYYDQNRVVILPYIFEKLHMPFTHWTILIGALAGLASSQLAGMYPLPRIIYSMARDRLIYGSLAHIHETTRLPVRATIVGSIAVALLACAFDIESLADMVSIGTLAAYSLVSLSVLILRYEERNDTLTDSTSQTNHQTLINILENSHINYKHHHTPTPIVEEKLESQNLKEPQEISSSKHPKLAPKPSTPIREKGSKPLAPQLSVGFQSWFKSENDQSTATGQQQSLNYINTKPKPNILCLLKMWKRDIPWSQQEPDDHTSNQSKILISLIVAISIILDLAIMLLINSNHDNILSKLVNFSNRYKILIASIVGIASFLLLVILCMLSRLPVRQRNCSDNKNFQVPLVPLLPTISILINTFLMLNLSILTWFRFVIWMAFGLVIYFTYGIWKSRGYLLNVDS